MTEEIKEDKPKEDWMTKKWRPMMAIMYMICCLADFFLFPIMFTVVQFWEVSAANDAFRQWVPITLQGGGLFHVAMGAVLGVAAYGRTQEKLGGVASGPTNLPTSGVPTPQLSTAAPAPQPAAYSPPVAQPQPYQPPVVAPQPEIRMINGKPAPAPAYQPEI
jgi:hypothetical protein